VTSRVAGFACAFLLSAGSAHAQPSAPDPDRIEPDRPDVTNSAHIVGVGEVQIEIGSSYTRAARHLTSAGSPILARIGVSTWMEARISSDGLVTSSNHGTRETGFGNVQAAAKLRLVGDSRGAPIVAVLPAVNLPTASAAKGLGSGDADYTITVLTGFDIGTRGHVDANYGYGRIGAGGGRPHFGQHLLSVSASVAAGAHWDPYAEAFWFSAQEPDGGAVAALDVGAICRLGHRLAVDGGLQVGISHRAPDLAAFAGFTFGLKRSTQ